MGFPRQEYWYRLPIPSPGDLPNPGIEPTSPELAGGFFTTKPLGKPSTLLISGPANRGGDISVSIDYFPAIWNMIGKWGGHLGGEKFRGQVFNGHRKEEKGRRCGCKEKANKTTKLNAQVTLEVMDLTDSNILHQHHMPWSSEREMGCQEQEHQQDHDWEFDFYPASDPYCMLFTAYLTSLSFHFLFCKIGMVVSTSEMAVAPHSSTLAWKIPWTEEPGRLWSMGSLRVRHDWVNSLSLFTFTHWRSKWQPTPVFLPGESQGWGSLVACRLWGRTELDTTELT